MRLASLAEARKCQAVARDSMVLLGRVALIARELSHEQCVEFLGQVLDSLAPGVVEEARRAECADDVQARFKARTKGSGSTGVN